MSDQQHLVLGRAGERFAERHLLERGWHILERNWHGQGGELDLIALDGEALVFVEVKTRRGERMGTAEEAVDARKAARLLRLGEQYLVAHPEHGNRFWRVDVIALTLDRRGALVRLSHLENACYLDG